MPNSSHFSLLNGFLGLFALGAIIHLLSPILMPFVLGAVFAYLADPWVNRLVRLKVPSILAVIIVFLTMVLFVFLVFLILIPIIEKQIDTLVMMIPRVVAFLQDKIIPWLNAHFSVSLDTVNIASLKNFLSENWLKAGGFVNIVLKTLLSSGATLFHWLITLFLIPVVTFYLLCDWKKILVGSRNMLPRRFEATMIKLFSESSAVLAAFVRGQLLVMLCLSLYYAIALNVIGLPLGITIGVVAGLSSIIPYLGAIIGVTTAGIVAYTQFGLISDLGMVFLVFILGHLLESWVLTPSLVGNRIGLHPVAVIFAVLAGGTLFGLMGILLALPLAAMLMVWIRYFYDRYRHSDLYQA